MFIQLGDDLVQTDSIIHVSRDPALPSIDIHWRNPHKAVLQFEGAAARDAWHKLLAVSSREAFAPRPGEEPAGGATHPFLVAGEAEATLIYQALGHYADTTRDPLEHGELKRLAVRVLRWIDGLHRRDG